jgi:hypothetical protein
MRCHNHGKGNWDETVGASHGQSDCDLFEAFWQLPSPCCESRPRRRGTGEVTPALFARMQAALAWQIPQWQDVRYIHIRERGSARDAGHSAKAS